VVAALAARGRVLRLEVGGASLEDIFVELTKGRDERRNRIMSALSAVMYREGKIRATNALFIFWDVVYPLRLPAGVRRRHERRARLLRADRPTTTRSSSPACWGWPGFGIASNTAWSFFMDRDNGIFYEMLTYPLSRAEYLIGKVLYQHRHRPGAGADHRAARVGGARRRARGPAAFPLLAAAVVVGTAGWFFFYAIFALAIRRNDAFNTVTSIFYFRLPVRAARCSTRSSRCRGRSASLALANPITWHVDVMRFATIGARRSAADRARVGWVRSRSPRSSYAGPSSCSDDRG
jgi:hypothetical protein